MTYWATSRKNTSANFNCGFLWVITFDDYMGRALCVVKRWGKRLKCSFQTRRLYVRINFCLEKRSEDPADETGPWKLLADVKIVFDFKFCWRFGFPFHISCVETSFLWWFLVIPTIPVSILPTHFKLVSLVPLFAYLEQIKTENKSEATIWGWHS